MTKIPDDAIARPRASAGPLFEEPRPIAPAAPPPTFSVHAMLDGFPVVATVAGSAEALLGAITRLKQIGATPPSTVWATTPEGLPICPRHGVPMKRREKQGDTWYSHVVTGRGGEDCYCRGYKGKDSPGWEIDV